MPQLQLPQLGGKLGDLSRFCYVFSSFFVSFLYVHFSLSRVNVASAVNILSSTSTSFGGTQHIDEKLQRQLLEEEEKAMNQFKVTILQ